MDGNLMLERQSPIGGIGPPPRGGPRGDYHPPFFRKGAPSFPNSGPPPPPSGPAPATSQSMTIPRSPRLLITPSSPDNVGPALGRLGRSIGLAVEMLATVGKKKN